MTMSMIGLLHHIQAAAITLIQRRLPPAEEGILEYRMSCERSREVITWEVKLRAVCIAICHFFLNIVCVKIEHHNCKRNIILRDLSFSTRSHATNGDSCRAMRVGFDNLRRFVLINCVGIVTLRIRRCLSRAHNFDKSQRIVTI